MKKTQDVEIIEPICINCVFFGKPAVRDAKNQYGQCRADLPQLNPVDPSFNPNVGFWPVVREDDWCGHYQAPECEDPTNTILVGAVFGVLAACIAVLCC